MEISTIIILICGLFTILWASFSKKEQTRQKKICKILIGIFSLIIGLVIGLTDFHLVSGMALRIFHTISDVAFGIILGIVLTLIIFGEVKLRKNKN